MVCAQTIRCTAAVAAVAAVAAMAAIAVVDTVAVVAAVAVVAVVACKPSQSMGGFQVSKVITVISPYIITS